MTIKKHSRYLLVTSVLLAAGCGTDNNTNQNTGADEKPLAAPSLAVNNADQSLDTEQAFSMLMNNKGGMASQCSVTPALPTGLHLLPSGGSCTIAGATLAEMSPTTFTVTARNSAGASSVEFELDITDEAPLQAPAFENGLATSSTANAGQSYLFRLPNTSGAISACHVSPALPEGLVLITSANGCVISGAANTTLASTDFTITAENAAGAVSHTLAITIIGGDTLASPMLVNPTQNRFTTSTHDVLAIQLDNTGGPANECSIQPTLPDGFAIYKHQGTCGVIGASAMPNAETEYQLSANNSSGASTIGFSLTVNEPAIALPNFTSSNALLTPQVGDAVFHAIDNNGGRVFQCNSSPELPAGLQLSATNGSCVIHGKARVAAQQASYKISGTNASGTSEVNLIVNITPVSAPTLTAEQTAFSLDTDEAFSLTLNNTGGAISECTAAPSLPDGLHLISAENNCIVAGATLTEIPPTSYQITASNSTGSASVNIQITVTDSQPLLAPDLGDQPQTLNGTVHQSLQIHISNQGGVVAQCNTVPALPTGLLLVTSPEACVVAGAANTALPPSAYRITATNSAGSSSTDLTISISGGDAIAVPQLVAPVETNLLLTTHRSFNLQLQNSGGAASTCNATPALPEGLVIYETRGGCGISGAVSQVSASQNYRLAAVNASGNSTVDIRLQIEAPALTSPQMTQTDLSTTLTVGDTLLLDMLNEGGAVSACSSTPVLPAGLSTKIVGDSCVVHGTALLESASQDYQISATNTVGTDELLMSITVEPQPPQAPAFVALGSNFFSWQQGSAVALALTNTGGTVDRCESEPTLPMGLNIVIQDGSCAVIGQPSAPVSSATYVLSGRNNTSTTKQEVIIEVPASNTYTGDGPDPEGYDHIAVLAENRSVDNIVTALHTDINDESSVLRIGSTGFPNRITQVQTSHGQLITDADAISDLFSLFIDPVNGIVEIHAKTTFDAESDPLFFSIQLELGTETQNILLRLYDIQRGNASEPLTISNFAELVSFLEGEFTSEHIGFDLINLSTASNQNMSDLHVRLDRDIDARSTEQTPWPGYNLKGTLDGNRHIITGLRLAERAVFLKGKDRFNPIHLKNIGLVDVKATGSLITSSSVSDSYENIFVEGLLDYSGFGSNVSINASPFSMSGTVKSVYSNMFIDLGDRGNRLIRAGGFMTTPAAPVFFHSGYANGSIEVDPDIAFYGRVGGYQGLGGQLSIYANQVAMFISAMRFDIPNESDPSRPTTTLVGGFGSASLRLPPLTNSPTDYTWRFIKDRGDTDIVRHVGNSARDMDNDGVADTHSDTNWESAGILEVDAKRSSSYTGEWGKHDFDITDGYIPVLKNMPYPHIEGATWMDAEDPSVVYQRMTYDKYLTDPRLP
ncbi:Uncharacterised protein [BD1-7 clade bacterium]|uniref:Uncharacterized protein n=1 Tax=BD1-7 clade bacterium TaxID=2029982 RepID=A0A5S9PHP6_9GAMM|nr:Uncharacterised protein [BD1-7 clade bacterium]CAA0103515.1 Uncharacterised protein [BD1-7 clade bacterium]